VITSAALIMTGVFLSFIANPSPLVQMMGLGAVNSDRARRDDRPDGAGARDHGR